MTGHVLESLSGCIVDNLGRRLASIFQGWQVLAKDGILISVKRKAGGVHTAKAHSMSAFFLADSIDSNYLAGPSTLILQTDGYLLIFLSPVVPWSLIPGCLPFPTGTVAHALDLHVLCW
ncbi:hypothetical protein DPMN_030411 [Dreissena polymorpha]|uniref:Uncharacterized protein n=1 Tax=Dreissena polymorpha TaxID=45954 RepID=A0A9D4RI98_DREPO|nr:hypothetical protein DPMN_030411 [Dreissena polymorpha]